MWENWVSISPFIMIFICHFPVSIYKKSGGTFLEFWNVNVFLARSWWLILNEAWSCLLHLTELIYHISSFLSLNIPLVLRERGRGTLKATATFLDANNKFVPTPFLSQPFLSWLCKYERPTKLKTSSTCWLHFGEMSWELLNIQKKME